MSKFWNMALVFLSLAGLSDATYITWEELSNQVPPCFPQLGFDCGAVLRSPWAYIGPLPLSVLGLGFYATMLGVATYLWLAPSPHRLARPLLGLLSVSGFLFSGFLVYLQAVIIGAYCLYCMISALTSTLLFVSAMGYLKTSSRQTNQAPVED